MTKREYDVGEGCFAVFFCFVAIVAMGILGVTAWAIIELVSWLTRK